MPRATDLYAVILAAGESTRMDGIKALLPWPPATPGLPPTGQTFLSAAIQALYPFSEKVIVVVGKNENNLAPVVYANGASLVRNPDPDRVPPNHRSNLKSVLGLWAGSECRRTAARRHPHSHCYCRTR